MKETKKWKKGFEALKKRLYHSKPKKSKVIKSIDELKILADKGIEVSILLAGGIARSTKFVDYNKKTKKFYIENYIDGSKEKLTEKQLAKYTNIPEAIKKNALILAD